MIAIEDPRDPRVRDYTSLTDVALRSRREPAEGLFMAEGELVIRRAVAAGFCPRSFLMSERWLEGLDDVISAHPDAPVLVASEPLLEGITGFSVHRGALAAMDRKPLPSVDSLLASSRRIVVLEDVVNHTNVGAAFRSVAALGVDAVLVTPRCADPLYRRSVKVSMGTVFAVPWTRIDPWPDSLGLLHEAGFSVLALTPAADSVDLRNLTPPPKWALLMGTEGDGLSAETMAAADVRVRIPMSSGVDSLNVAAATAVACYALTAP